MVIHRLNTFNQQYVLSGDHSDSNCRIQHGLDYIDVAVNIHTLDQAWYDWQMQHLHIQAAFPMLTAAEREFILTGITPSRWAAMFAEEEQ